MINLLLKSEMGRMLYSLDFGQQELFLMEESHKPVQAKLSSVTVDSSIF